MKKYGTYNETLTVLKEIEPAISADDYYDNYGVVPQKVSAFWIGIGDGNGVISMSRMKMTGVSEKYRWHERLKKSYEVIKSEWKGDKDELVKY